MRLVILNIVPAFWPVNGKFVRFGLSEAEDRQRIAQAINRYFDQNALLRDWDPVKRTGRFVLFPRAGELAIGEVINVGEWPCVPQTVVFGTHGQDGQ